MRITVTLLPTNSFVSTTTNSMKCLVKWIPLRIRVRSRNNQPRGGGAGEIRYLVPGENGKNPEDDWVRFKVENSQGTKIFAGRGNSSGARRRRAPRIAIIEGKDTFQSVDCG